MPHVHAQQQYQDVSLPASGAPVQFSASLGGPTVSYGDQQPEISLVSGGFMVQGRQLNGDTPPVDEPNGEYVPVHVAATGPVGSGPGFAWGITLVLDRDLIDALYGAETVAGWTGLRITYYSTYYVDFSDE